MHDKKFFTDIREEIDQVLKTVGDKHNLIFKSGNISYTANEFSIKINAVIKTKDDGEVFDKRKEDFDKYCHIYQLKPEDFGRSFQMSLNGEKYTIAGINRKAKDYPIIIKNEKGKLYRYKRSAIVF